MEDLEILELALAQFQVPESDADENRAFRFDDLSEETIAEGFEGYDEAELESIQLTPEQIQALLSDKAHQLIIASEISSPAYYERRLSQPTWPGEKSGITIGIGFDLGYHSHNQFEESFGSHLEATAMQRLSPAIGKTPSNTRVQDLKQFAQECSDIRVPLAAAADVHKRFTVPRYAKLMLRIYPEATKLHPHCSGALLSLCFNRGTSLRGDRRREMANIQKHLRSGNLSAIPDEFRSMKRIWAGRNLRGLLRRRDQEAALFEEGLAAAQGAVTGATPPIGTQPATPTPPPIVDLPDPTPPITQPAAAPGAGFCDPDGPLPARVPVSQPAPSLESLISPNLETIVPNGAGGLASADDMNRAVLETLAREAEGDEAYWDFDEEHGYTWKGEEDEDKLERTQSWSTIEWVSDDTKSTEYNHLTKEDRAQDGAPFEFTSADFNTLIAANRFLPMAMNEGNKENKVVLGLRGCMLVDANGNPGTTAQQNVSALRLIPARPNHKDFRCVMCVVDVDSGQLSGFPASTVANRYSIDRASRKNGNGANLLPAGCYNYKVGRHGWDKRRNRAKNLGCLREDQPFCVLRNAGGRKFDDKDRWTLSPWPYDNIHPAWTDGRGSAEFSSFGCLVIKGAIRNRDQHSGDWASFREALGLQKAGTGDHGRTFSTVLLTGTEAAIASRLRLEGREQDKAIVDEKLGRLRHGSQGTEVRRLQQFMGSSVDGSFGAGTKAKLVAFQQARFEGAANGVFCPGLDAKLSAGVFTPKQQPQQPTPPPPVQPVDPTPAPGPIATNGSGPGHVGNGAHKPPSPPEPAVAPAKIDWGKFVVDDDLGGDIWTAESIARPHRPAGLDTGDDLESLYYEIGRQTKRLELAQQISHLESVPGGDPNAYIDQQLEGIAFDSLVAFGRVFAARLERRFHALICGDPSDPEAQIIRAQLITAVAHGRRYAVEALTGIIMVRFGVFAHLCQPVAHVIFKRILDPLIVTAGQQLQLEIGKVCQVWSADLRSRDPLTLKSFSQPHTSV